MQTFILNILASLALCGISNAANVKADALQHLADTRMRPIKKHVEFLQKRASSKRMRGNNDDADADSANTDSDADNEATDGEDEESMPADVSGQAMPDSTPSQVQPQHHSLPATLQTQMNTQVKDSAKAQFQLRKVPQVKAELQVSSVMDSNDVDDDLDDEDEYESDEDPGMALEKAKVEADLKGVKVRKQKAQLELARFKNSEAFKAKLEIEKMALINETASPAFAQFLTEMRNELRTYATPSYQAHLEHKASDLEAQEKELAAKIAALEKKESGDDRGSTEADTEDAATDTHNKIARLQAALSMKSATAGHVFAIAFMGVIVMLSVLFAMASPNQKDAKVKNYTWFIIDQVILIFLAVMYFQAFEEMLDFIELGDSESAVSVSHALAVLSLALITAYFLRNRAVGLAVICGAGAHLASFTSIHAGATVQNNIWMSMNYSWYSCLMGLIVYCVFIVILGFAIFHIKRVLGVDQDEEFMDRTTDLENDFGAMGMAVIWTMFVRYVLTGHHPVDDDTEFDHTQVQRNKMLIYAILTIPTAGLIVFLTSKVSSKSYPMFIGRVCTFIASVSAMNVAWGWLYWGEWQFFETVYAGNPLFGRVLWAMIASSAGVLGIFALTLIPIKKAVESSEERKVASVVGKCLKVGLSALGLVIAWSWELCFDSAVDDLTEGTKHRHIWKMATCLVMFATVIPVYGVHVYPITSEAAEAIGA